MIPVVSLFIVCFELFFVASMVNSSSLGNFFLLKLAKTFPMLSAKIFGFICQNYPCILLYIWLCTWVIKLAQLGLNKYTHIKRKEVEKYAKLCMDFV